MENMHYLKFEIRKNCVISEKGRRVNEIVINLIESKRKFWEVHAILKKRENIFEIVINFKKSL